LDPPYENEKLSAVNQNATGGRLRLQPWTRVVHERRPEHRSEWNAGWFSLSDRCLGRRNAQRLGGRNR
ncbi:MAG TPA: hypothetical protein VG122_21150, partial [Gemmata sp.]|nr:hypothetical protein [Gemmata sp.]